MNAPLFSLVPPATKRRVKVLFIHQNFPGQFGRIAVDLARDPAYDVLAVGKHGCPRTAGVRTVTYQLHRGPTRGSHHYAKSYESGILHGQACLRLLLALKGKGYEPDVIVAHPGWGETLFVREAFPHTRLIHFCEFYYHADGADVGFDPEFPATLDDRARVHARNGLQLLNLDACDIAVTPTHWQKKLHPKAYHDKLRVIHEGIDTAYMRPDALASFTLPNGKVLHAGDPVVTYVARNLEPYRGFHIFMRALPQILARNPHCDILIAGGDSVSYGSKPGHASHWREKMMREVTFDTSRVHFLDRIPYAEYRRLLQVSAAHLYLTYPFVLSWSMLEAMACGCLLIGSRTAPVCEVVRDGDNGMLVDFFSMDEIVQKVSAVLADPARFAPMRERAMTTIQTRYSVADGISAYRKLIDTALDSINQSTREAEMPWDMK